MRFVFVRGPGLVDGFAGVVPVMPPMQGSGIHGVMGIPGRRPLLACPGLSWVGPLGFRSYASLAGLGNSWGNGKTRRKRSCLR